MASIKYVNVAENEEQEQPFANESNPPNIGKHITRLCLDRMVEDSLNRRPEEMQLFHGVPVPTTKLHHLPMPPMKPEELILPEFEQKMRVAIKKCMIRKVIYDILSIENFKEWFEVVHRMEKATMMKNREDEVAKFLFGEGPHKFYVIFQYAVDLHKLFHYWLLDMVMDDVLEDVKKEDLARLQGKYVLVKVSDDRYPWYRALVLECLTGNTVNLSLPDIGRILLNVPYSDLKRLPDNFRNLHNLAVLARLNGVESDDLALNSDVEINENCIRLLSAANPLYISTVGFHKYTKSRIVELWTLDHGCRRDIGSEILNSIQAWQRGPLYGLTQDELMELFVDEDGPDVYGLLKRCRISYVVNPQEFYVLRDDSDDQKLLDERMKSFYTRMKDTERYTIRSGGVTEGQYCVVKDSVNTANHTYHRVRVLKSCLEAKVASVFFIDIGITKDVNFNKIRRIIPEFCKVHALAVQCSLGHISPIEETWSERVVSSFIQILDAFKHRMEMTPTKYWYIEYGKRHKRSKMSMEIVIILQMDPGNYNTTLQYELNRLGLAKSRGVLCGNVASLDQLRTSEFLEVFNRGRSFDDNKKNWELTLDSYNSKAKKQDSDSANLKQLPVEVRKCICWVRILHASSPGRIYVQLQERVPMLFNMMEMLENYTRHVKSVPVGKREKGRFVAVNLRKEESGCDDDGTFRAIVTRCPAEGLISVFLVDFVKEVETTWNCCYLLPQRYIQIPSFSHRIHLDVGKLVPNTGTMQLYKIGNSVFRYLIPKRQVDDRIYFIWRHERCTSVSLTEFNQSVHYSRVCKDWLRYSSPNPVMNDSNAVDENRSCIMLSNLFISVEAVIQYENFHGPQRQYGFLPRILI